MGNQFQTRESGSQPARVLLVAPSSPPYGGMALQARLLEELLRRDGQSVAFFASNFGLPRALEWVNRLPGVRTVMRFTLIWFQLLRAASEAEIVHVFAASWAYFYLVVWPAVLVGRLAGARVVLNYRGGEADKFLRWNRWFAAPVFKLAHLVTAPSPFLTEIIGRRMRTPVFIVPNLLDTAIFSYRQRTSVRPKIVVARHLEVIYDIESVLKAFRRIQERHPESSLDVAGSGSQRQYLEGLVSQWGLRNVSFLGHVAHDALPKLYENCDIFLNASRVDNFPGALVEASAAGLIVVSTCAGGIPYIYENEKNALLVDVGAWEALADAVERLVESPSLGLGLSREALMVVEQCHWTQVRNSLYQAYGLPAERDQRADFLMCGSLDRAMDEKC